MRSYLGLTPLISQWCCNAFCVASTLKQSNKWSGALRATEISCKPAKAPSRLRTQRDLLQPECGGANLFRGQRFARAFSALYYKGDRPVSDSARARPRLNHCASSSTGVDGHVSEIARPHCYCCVLLSRFSTPAPFSRT